VSGKCQSWWPRTEEEKEKRELAGGQLYQHSEILQSYGMARTVRNESLVQGAAKLGGVLWWSLMPKRRKWPVWVLGTPVDLRADAAGA
jgi:hypothetical protein